MEGIGTWQAGRHSEQAFRAGIASFALHTCVRSVASMELFFEGCC